MTEVQKLRAEASAALAAVFEHRRRHSPTTEWKNRERELDSYFIDCAERFLNAHSDDERAELRREQDRAELRIELDRVRQERDEARDQLVAALQTIEAAAATAPASPTYAVWLVSRGWLICRLGPGEPGQRLSEATKFATEEQARAALEQAEREYGYSYAYLSEFGEVVSL